MIEPKKSLGQHWLKDEDILESICNTAEVEPGDEVLEIGPGQGTLTKVLLDKGAKVTAVELDGGLADELTRNIQDKNLKIINQDIMKFNLNDLPFGYKVVANIPYYLTSNLIRVLSESDNPAASMTLLVQKEVAERICAAPGEMSILSVSAQVYHRCSLGPVVPADKFFPPPKVDSQVVHMVRRAEPFPAGIAPKVFFRMVKAGFSNRRKTLQNSLAGGLHISKPQSEKLLLGASINPNARAQELSLDDWFRLAGQDRA
jgi:16S rRNA (adenine1518-N6/adenine1519-N6)-dimethyltransferase